MSCVIVWFRNDLRLADHAALRAACASGRPVLPVYIHAPQEAGEWAPGAASRWWLHHSLEALGESLRKAGSRLLLATGDSADVLTDLARRHQAERVFATRAVEPALQVRDERVSRILSDVEVDFVTEPGTLLFEPGTVMTQQGTPYRVFTPFWRACQALGLDEAPLAAPKNIPAPRIWPASAGLDSLDLLPRTDWAAGLRDTWRPGEAAARAGLKRFAAEGAADYPDAHDRPDQAGTSRLSPHLHFGEISPRQVIAMLRAAVHQDTAQGRVAGAEAVIRQLGWREFAHHILQHFPHTVDRPLDAKFERFKWQSDDALFNAWCAGRTGYPIVDAGMRELWRTGFMHNRVRMITASFLTKHGLTDWRRGARWFWDTLVDADLASNTLNWQWVAGCGADAAPYFRIFNPVTQSRRIDPDGRYLARWVPELERLPPRWRHAPWEAPDKVLHAAKWMPGRDYQAPILDLSSRRELALTAFRKLK